MSRASQFTRIHLLFLAVFLITGVIIARLFYLQVLYHGYYNDIAQAEQYGYSVLPARRGEILIEDYQSGTAYKLATNTTLNMIYADPTMIEEPTLVAETLAPYLFDLDVERDLDDQRYEEKYEEIMKIEDENLRNKSLSELSHKSDEELLKNFTDNLENTLAKRTREVIQINTDPLDAQTQEEIRALNLAGFVLSDTGNLFAYPAQITDKAKAAKALAEVFNADSKDLESIFLGKNRYVVLKRKLDPEASNAIEAILEADRIEADELDQDPKFWGIRMQEEYFRFYPEKELAAQVLGYVNSAGEGQYGIEGSFDELLQGKNGSFSSKVDVYGNQITVGESVIEEAEDGANITLTIDRAIQLQVERALKGHPMNGKGVLGTRADSGQVIVINPKTGDILAMANYPTFDPNNYGDVFKKVKIDLSEEDKENLYKTGTEEDPKYWLYIQRSPDVRIEVFPDPEAPEVFYRYENNVGPEVYKNRSIQDIYEPGSVFKPITMAAAINAGEVTASTTFVDEGCTPVDYNVHTGEYDYCLENFDKQHHGVQTMTQVLEKSNNMGMIFVARKLGPSLFYSYLKNYGLLEKTGIELEDESVGSLEHYRNWTESEMVTKAFGQGLSLSPLQLIKIYTALANDGIMMQPRLVKKIEYPDGRVEEFEPVVVRQVLTEETTEMITAMLVATAQSYKSMGLENHYFAGKSGTAQTYKNGVALSGVGTTNATFMVYGPIEDPQFLILVRLEHPRSVEWAEGTSGPIAKELLSFLFDYYNIPPDKK